MLLALTMVAACGGVKGPVRSSNDAALGGSGSGGSATGTGGAIVGTGGAVGTGGSASGTGGAVVGTGGATLGAGGSVIGTGGTNFGRGGATGTGGTVVGTGGTTIGRGGTTGTGGSAIGRGGATGTGGTVLGTGGTSLGRGGATGGRGGSGGNAVDAGTSCSSWTSMVDCRDAGCTPLVGVKNGTSEIGTFFGCLSSACPPVVVAAYPSGEPDNCYVFPGGCIPDGWTLVSGSSCPTTVRSFLPTITEVRLGLNCMPGAPSATDKLYAEFDVTYDNTRGTTAAQATVKSATLMFTDSTTPTISFAVIPSESGPVPAGKSVAVTHKKDPNSASGLGCACNPPLSAATYMVWEIDGESFSGTFGTRTATCAY
jgi:hypothetical protein